MAVVVTQSSRDLNQLNPIVKVMADLAIAEATKKGINVLVTETYRPLERQYYIACHGRTVEEAVKLGVPKAKAEKYVAQLKVERYTGGQRTWTVNSIHITKKALDAVPQRSDGGTIIAVWNAADAQTKQLVSIMSKYGFEAGANWSKNADSPHFQVKGNFTSIVNKSNTTYYLTVAIQKALTLALGKAILIDGKWGSGTDTAITEFRKKMKYKVTSPVLGAQALKALLSYLA